MRVLLVDDEPIVRRDLRRLLAAFPDLEVVGEAGNGVEALDRIEALQPDAVFLDVAMPELDGFGVVEALAPAEAPLVVFVTAHDRFALAAFDAEAVDYLLKPFDDERLGRAVDRLRSRRQEAAAGRGERLRRAARAVAPYLDRIAVRTTDHAVVIPVAAIRRIESSRNYARLVLADRTLLTRRTMRDLAERLDPASFVRVHRSHIIALAAVRAYRLLGDGDAEVTLQGGDVVPVSRAHRTELEDRLGGIA